MNESMTHKVSHIEEVITQFRHMSPTEPSTAQAIDKHEHWERKAVDDGDIERAFKLVRFLEARMGRSG